MDDNEDGDNDYSEDGDSDSDSEDEYTDEQLGRERLAFAIGGIEALESQPPVLILTSHLGEGSTGNAHGGFLEMKNETGSYRLHIVAKLAFDQDQKQRLQTEYNVYDTLREQGVKGIPTALGFYHNPRIQSAPYCLITTYAGSSLLGADDSKERHISTITSEQRHVSSFVIQACN